MALSSETIKLRQERERMRESVENPTPGEKAEVEAYWRENPDLFVTAPK